MYFINFNKRLVFSFQTLVIVLLSVISITSGTINSSAGSVSDESYLRGKHAFGNLKETERFGFLTENITTLFNTNNINRMPRSSQLNRSEEIESTDSAIFDEFDAWVNFYVNNGFRADAEQMNLGENLAVRRKQALKEFIQINPKAAFEKVISAEIFNRLPSSIIEHSEKRISVNGDFLVYIFDEANRSNESRIERYIVAGDVTYKAVVYGRREAMTTKLDIPLYGFVIDDTMVVDESPARKIDSSEYEERAVDESKISADEIAAEVGGKVVYFSDQSSFDNFVREQIEWEAKIGPVRPREKLAPDELASPWTEGAKTVLVIRVDFSDKVGEPLDFYNQPLTVERAQNLFNNEVNAFYVNNSYNKTSMQATVTPVVRLPQTRAYYAGGFFNTMLSDARNAARVAGFETNNFDLDVVAFSYTSSIGWLGIAGVGSKGNMLNGAFFLQEAAHELGHNYGLLHANLWRTTDGNPIGQGTNVEYGDCFDDMGACVNQSVNSHFNTHYKRLLDWLTDANVQTVTSNGTYRIFAQDSISPGGIRTLKIQKDGTKNYWIEFRQLFQSAANGALIRWDYASRNFLETQLLDMNPNTTSAYDAPLLIGQSFYDSASPIRITVIGKGNTTPESLDVKVEFGQPTAAAYEADVDPAPNGNQLMQSSDVVQMRLFLNCTGTQPDASTSEFQRADSSPFDPATGTYGDGRIQSDDIVQTRRYLNQSDARRTAAGPTAPSGVRCGAQAPILADEQQNRSVQQTVDAPEGGIQRQLRVQNVITSSPNRVTVDILVDAAGDEAEYGFTINYTTSILSNPVIVNGTTDDAARSCNTTTTPGRIFCSVGNFPTDRTGDPQVGEIAPGVNQVLIRVTFTVASGLAPQTTAVTLTDVNASRDTPPLAVTITSMNGTVSITGPTAATASIGGRVLTGIGKGIGNARVTLTDANGNERIAMTTSFGYYNFADAAAGETYLISVAAKRYVFSQPTPVLTVNENISDLNFIAQQ